LPKTWTLRWQVPFAAVLLVLGIMLSVQFKAQQTLSTALEYQNTEDLVAMWRELNTKRERLRQEIGELRAKEALLAEQSAQGRSTRENLERDLARLQAAGGLAPVRGPGITVTLTGETPLLYYDLADLVNELWASGAEAIAVNDQRLTALAAIGEMRQGETYYLTLDGRRLLYPIVVKALGDPNTLEKGLTFTGGLIDNFNTLYAIYPRIEKHGELALPGARPATWHYAQPKGSATPALKGVGEES
jgi:uncharacterized protein YlxW (UPF0749 family)